MIALIAPTLSVSYTHLVDELVGRSDLLKVRDNLTGHAAKLDLKNILENPFASSKDKVIFDPKKVYDFELQKTADEKVLLKQMKTALEQKQKRSIEINVSNTNRSFGTIFGSEITRRYKDTLEAVSYTHLHSAARCWKNLIC